MGAATRATRATRAARAVVSASPSRARTAAVRMRLDRWRVVARRLRWTRVAWLAVAVVVLTSPRGAAAAAAVVRSVVEAMGLGTRAVAVVRASVVAALVAVGVSATWVGVDLDALEEDAEDGADGGGSSGRRMKLRVVSRGEDLARGWDAEIARVAELADKTLRGAAVVELGPQSSVRSDSVILVAGESVARRVTERTNDKEPESLAVANARNALLGTPSSPALASNALSPLNGLRWTEARRVWVGASSQGVMQRTQSRAWGFSDPLVEQEFHWALTRAMAMAMATAPGGVVVDVLPLLNTVFVRAMLCAVADSPETAVTVTTEVVDDVVRLLNDAVLLMPLVCSGNRLERDVTEQWQRVTQALRARLVPSSLGAAAVEALLNAFTTLPGTASAALYFLASEPAIQARLRASLPAEGADLASGKAPTEMRAVVLETLRLASPTPLVTRVVRDATDLAPSGREPLELREVCPSGKVWVALQHLDNSRVATASSPPPARFDPFRDANASDVSASRAFGMGPRDCPFRAGAVDSLARVLTVVLRGTSDVQHSDATRAMAKANASPVAFTGMVCRPFVDGRVRMPLMLFPSSPPSSSYE